MTDIIAGNVGEEELSGRRQVEAVNGRRQMEGDQWYTVGRRWPKESSE